MSEIKEEFLKQLAEDGDIDRKKKEVQAARVEKDWEKLKENEQKAKDIDESDFGSVSPEYAESLAKQSAKYFEDIKTSMKFICKTFDNMVPYFQGNLILIGADTGNGKSTCVANIVRNTLAYADPKTGKARRCLVITNEENVVDFYNRVTCLIKGWHYVNHDLFTQEQKDTMIKYIPILARKLTVVDDTHDSKGKEGTGFTTTCEGLEHIFSKLIENKDFYDVVLIDYYQGFIESTEDPRLDEFKVQRKVSHILDAYRKEYPAPIILMAQAHAPTAEELDADRISPFQTRIHGTKMITTKATVIMEMLANRRDLQTKWHFHKGRFSEYTGSSVSTGYDNGSFVYLTPEFMESVRRKREQEAAREQDRQIGITTEQTQEIPNG